jgi:hypothetical protein
MDTGRVIQADPLHLVDMHVARQKSNKVTNQWPMPENRLLNKEHL